MRTLSDRDRREINQDVPLKNERKKDRRVSLNSVIELKHERRIYDRRKVDRDQS